MRLHRCIIVFAVAISGLLSIFVGAVPAQAVPSTASVSGTAIIKSAPPGFWNDYVQACPAGQPFFDGCSGGVIGTPSPTPGSYSISLAAPGNWRLGLYYYADHGQLINNVPVALTVRPGGSVTKNLVVKYQIPAAAGIVKLTNAPKNFGLHAYLGVQACPLGVTFAVGCPAGTEAYESINPGQPYSIDLTRGKWTLGAYYRVMGSAASFLGTPVTITALPSHTLTANVTIAYQGL